MKYFSNIAVISLIVCICMAGSANAQPQQGVVATTPQPLNTPDQQTVAINDTNLLQNSGVDFTFSRTLGQILASAMGPAANTPANRLNFLDALLKTFAAKTATNPLSNVTVTLAARPGELSLNPADLLDPSNIDFGVRPIGLFNRLDLMPSNAATCGEYRIIYATGEGAPPALRHFTIIFEAALDNPNPQQGAAGCLPVAQFWSNLKNLSGVPLARALEQFYYTGIPGASGPVVDFKNYGNPFGQIRASTFSAGDPDWRMREWLIKKTSTGVGFAIHFLRNNPMITLYEVPGQNDSPQLLALRGSFQNEFIGSFIQQLTAVDATGWQNTITDSTLFFNLGVHFEDKYSDFESSQQGETDRPLSHVDPQFAQKIQTRLNFLHLPWPVSSTEVLGRADVQTCGGCHRDLTPNDVAPSSIPHLAIAWPGTLPFTHVGEQGQLSLLLVDRFLPSRFAYLSNFLAHPPAPAVSRSVPTMAQKAAGIRAALGQINLSPNPDAMLHTLDNTIEKVRQEDRRTPGYFVQFRPAD